MATAHFAPATLAVTAGRPSPEAGNAVNPPVVLTSTYHAAPDGGGPVYGRFTNPTWTALEEAVGALEGGDALAWSSGMAAIAGVLAVLAPFAADNAPPRVLAPRHAYGGTLALLRELAASGQILLEAVDLADTGAVQEALQRPALLVWVETPTNPMLEIADLPAVIAAAGQAGARVAVDNTFATPLVQRPLALGADVVVHSATKYLAGHSDVVLGATVTRDPDLASGLAHYRTLHGAIPGPWEAWLALRGLRTLHLRVDRACANATALARRLAQHPTVLGVRHPSLPRDPGHARAAAQMALPGAVICIEVSDAATAERVAAGVRLWVHATSLGGVESTLERRRRHPNESPTVPPGLLRLSVGVEDVEDLWSDLAEALDAAQAPRP